MSGLNAAPDPGVAGLERERDARFQAARERLNQARQEPAADEKALFAQFVAEMSQAERAYEAGLSAALAAVRGGGEVR